MTPAEENALVNMARPLGATNASRDAIRLAIRAAYAQGAAKEALAIATRERNDAIRASLDDMGKAQRAEEQVLSRIIGIATVGNIDGHEVIRRQSAIDVVRMVFSAIDAAMEAK